jgi:uncharacterized membrane protein SpoIIM required for sporulation
MIRSQDALVNARTRDWRELEGLVSRDALHQLDGPGISRAAALYRALCADLVRARSLRCSHDLVAYLDSLAGRAHSALYGAEPFRAPAIVRFFTRDFPRTLRQNARFFAMAWALFLIPCVVGVILGLTAPDLAAQITPRAQLEQMAQAYSEGFSSGRGEGTDAMMAGFYVNHNVGIAFRCFATGVFLGLGSVFHLVYNGLAIGTVTGYVTAAGYGHNIGTFMCGHGPFELTAIIVAGAAGLRMGWALVATNGRTRLGSLRAAAGEISRLILGAAAMLLIAAAIEGFWSPSSLPAPVKWAASVVFSLAVTAYFVFAGRDRAALRSAA